MRRSEAPLLPGLQGEAERARPRKDAERGDEGDARRDDGQEEDRKDRGVSDRPIIFSAPMTAFRVIRKNIDALTEPERARS